MKMTYKYERRNYWGVKEIAADTTEYKGDRDLFEEVMDDFRNDIHASLEFKTDSESVLLYWNNDADFDNKMVSVTDCENGTKNERKLLFREIKGELIERYTY